MKKFISFLFLTIILSSCIGSKNKTIKIGINPWPGYELVYTAKHFELYKKHGLDVEIIEFGSLSDVKTAYQNGQIDIMCSTLIEVVTSYADAGIESSVILATDYSNGPDVIIAKEKGLKGKRIAVETGSLGVFMLGMALEKEGVSLDEVNIVPSDQSSLSELFKAKKIDGAVTYPPFSFNLKKEHSELIEVFSSADIPFKVIDVLSAKKQFLKENPEIKKKIIRVWDDVLAQYKKDPEKYIPIMAKREKLKASEFKEFLEGLIFLDSRDQEKIDYKNAFNVTIKTLFKAGDIKKLPPVEVFLN